MSRRSRFLLKRSLYILLDTPSHTFHLGAKSRGDRPTKHGKLATKKINASKHNFAPKTNVYGRNKNKLYDRSTQVEFARRTACDARCRHCFVVCIKHPQCNDEWRLVAVASTKSHCHGNEPEVYRPSHSSHRSVGAWAAAQARPNALQCPRTDMIATKNRLLSVYLSSDTAVHWAELVLLLLLLHDNHLSAPTDRLLLWDGYGTL